MDLAERIALRSFLITLVVAMVAYILGSSQAAVAVLAGGLLALANFRFSSGTLRRMITPDIAASAGKSVAMLSFIIRYGLLCAMLYFAIKSGISPVFFIAGLSAVVGAIFVSYSDLKKGAL